MSHGNLKIVFTDNNGEFASIESVYNDDATEVAAIVPRMKRDGEMELATENELGLLLLLLEAIIMKSRAVTVMAMDTKVAS